MQQESAFRSLEVEIRKDLNSFRNVPEPIKIPRQIEDEVDFTDADIIVEKEAPKEEESKVRLHGRVSSIES